MRIYLHNASYRIVGMLTSRQLLAGWARAGSSLLPETSPSRKLDRWIDCVPFACFVFTLIVLALEAFFA